VSLLDEAVTAWDPGLPNMRPRVQVHLPAGQGAKP